MSFVNVEAIYTIKEYEQEFENIEVNLHMLTKKTLLHSLMEKLDMPKLVRLIKISTCFDTTYDNLPEFIIESNGKFYFEPKNNDGLENFHLLKEYVEYREKK